MVIVVFFWGVNGELIGALFGLGDELLWSSFGYVTVIGLNLRFRRQSW